MFFKIDGNAALFEYFLDGVEQFRTDTVAGDQRHIWPMVVLVLQNVSVRAQCKRVNSRCLRVARWRRHWTEISSTAITRVRATATLTTTADIETFCSFVKLLSSEKIFTCCVHCRVRSTVIRCAGVTYRVVHGELSSDSEQTVSSKKKKTQISVRQKKSTLDDDNHFY
jgi:hypothetical protein